MTLHVSALVGMFFSLLHCLFSFMNSMLSPLRPQAEPVQNWLPEMQSLVDSRILYTVKNIYFNLSFFFGGGGGGGVCSRYISSSTKYYAHKCTHVIVLSKTGIFYLTGPWTLWFCCCLCGVRKPSEFIKNIFICVLKMNKVFYRFGMTWGWQNDWIFIFGELTPFMHLHCNYRKHKHINFINNTKKY